MKSILIRILLALGLLMTISGSVTPILHAQEVDIDFGDQETIKELKTANKVKDLILAVLAWIICPVIGVVMAIKGWQMVGNAERGDKGQGAFVLVAGVLMAVLPTVFLQLYKAIQT